MSYSLSFSPEFFFAEGEPYDGGPEVSEAPISVWNAIESMRQLTPEDWADMARELFGVEPEYLTPEAVLEKIQETNTCRNLESPVEVYIDSEGNYSVEVYDR
jgi:hypothetical protein